MISANPPPSSIEQLRVPGRDQKGTGDPCKVRRPGDHAGIGCGAAERQACGYPIDRIPSDTPVMDLGIDALAALVTTLKKSGTVVFNGPAGVFEEPDFATGTFELLRAASKVEFSVVGGGHTAAVIEKLGIENDFTHISTGGGACIEFLTGKKLPAVEALEESYKLFG